MLKPVLLFAYGNISRGDDALAPLLLERIKHSEITQIVGHPVKFLTDYQMQIEHVTDMSGCERILLIDADKLITSAYSFYTVQAQLETSYTTHGMTPSTLLHTFQQVYNKPAPLTSMLAIAGSSFKLGQGLSKKAKNNLDQAEIFLKKILFHNDFTLWD
ncbi:MAG: hydrogenase maturation protease [Gammaproteobacteria bacterium]|jgi:hydrogenase maturation protease|nr:hydrogenase maturation protease [Gammaproteobacteria bacterium]MBT3721809.1 hydrogenase maturation protease [Gammaproteobacteria bacterium]MBT4077556.1 hydrogenase maturation protease [Gammaproteobacteria bacterium]MBT4195817.1 hydrogenase maturation protease [Gammaproteobacteria bacterium]MBT4450067.1 hydrogenase maturation protease [Gammaproteobacteria bacterium]